ncbi:hypothetical protein [Terribacillus saccharophilus]|uniref:hypothetical protein n=1 Tax=Terribacillus saccharophilus TaxID=361277 RepID=UPI000C9AF02A|nr:hypothetical protein [Terribacillus goriensis]
MSLQEILGWLSSIGLGVAGLFALFIFSVKHLIKTTINKNKEKYMQDYKYQLDRVMREAEHDFQRRIHDFGLYSTKRHEKYSETYRLLQIAYNAIVELSELKFPDDFNEIIDKEEHDTITLSTYLRFYDISEDDINKFMALNLDLHYKKLQAELIVINKFLQIAKSKYETVETFIIQNELFFSFDVESLTNACLSKIKSHIKYTKNGYNSEDILPKLELLKLKMKEEMSVGYYNERSHSD